MSETKPQIAKVSDRVKALEQQQPTYRAATVLAVNKALSTFDADVEGIGRVDGLTAPPHFLPAVGDAVLLRLDGALPTYQPGRVAEGAIGEIELAAPVVEKINIALDAANGKNKVTYSEDAPDDVNTPGDTAGDIWWQVTRVDPLDPNSDITVDGQWLWSGSTWAASTLSDEVFAYITAAKIVTGTLGVGVQITIGDPLGTHTVIDGARGLVAVDEDDQGNPAEVAQFGATSGGRDAATGRVTWSIDQQGHGSFTSASVEGDFRVGGEKIADLLADSAGNVIDYFSGTLGSDLTPIGTGEVGIVEVNGYLIAGRAYELAHRLSWYANDPGVTEAVIRPIWTGPTSAGSDSAPAPMVTGSPQTVTAYYQPTPTAYVYNSHSSTTLFEPDITGRHRFLLAIRRGALGGTIGVVGNRDIEWWLKDAGPKPPGAGGTISRGGGTLDGGAPPPPPPAPKVTRTDTWLATWSRSWRQDGSISFTGPMYQGYGDSFNGVQTSSVGFPDLTGALSGSTIHKVEIFLHAEHWYSFAGGTAGIGHHGALNLPSASPGIAGYFTVPGWKRNEGRWIDVTGWAADLAFGGIRGISLAAPNGSAAAEYYGRFSGHNGYKWPSIRIRYTK